MCFKYDFIKAKEEYRNFCYYYFNDIQIFAQPWYLDAVCEDSEEWQVILYKENKKIVAAFPFMYKKNRLGLKYICNPKFTPRLGIWIDYQGKTKEGEREAYENKIVKYIIDNLPQYDCFDILFDSRFQNWQQFYWEGFSQTNYYSYIMKKDIDLSNVLSKRTKKKIRSLKERYSVVEGDNLKEYWNFFTKSYRLRKREISYSEKNFFNICQAAQDNNACKLFFCKNNNLKTVAVACVFFDSRRMYKMFNSFDPNIDESVQPLITINSIEKSHEKNLDFDFEGSMIKGVANYNMQFNAKKNHIIELLNTANDICY